MKTFFAFSKNRVFAKQDITKPILNIFCCLLVSACGGGEGGGLDGASGNQLMSYLFYDDFFQSNDEQSTPTPAAENPKFPLALHYSTLLKSPTSKVGTTSISTYSVSGFMTTPNVSNGTYSAILNISRTWQSSTLFEGLSAIPIVNQYHFTGISFNGVGQTSETSDSVDYIDTNFGINIGGQSGAGYKVISSNSKAFPEFVSAGDSGTWLVYMRYTNSNKEIGAGFEIYSYRVVQNSRQSNGDLVAQVEITTQNYSTLGQLLQTTKSTEELLWTSSGAAGARRLSFQVEDIEGPITSRLTYTRTN